MRLRITGLPEPEATLLASVLRSHGFEVVSGEPEPSEEVGTIEPAERLTPRQLEILTAVARHGSASAAARALGLSAKTINAHLGHIYQRIGVRGRLLALCWACRRRLVRPGGEPAEDPDGGSQMPAAEPPPGPPPPEPGT